MYIYIYIIKYLYVWGVEGESHGGFLVISAENTYIYIYIHTYI